MNREVIKRFSSRIDPNDERILSALEILSIVRIWNGDDGNGRREILVENGINGRFNYHIIDYDLLKVPIAHKHLDGYDPEACPLYS